jgi:hypothetical protein
MSPSVMIGLRTIQSSFFSLVRNQYFLKVQRIFKLFLSSYRANLFLLIFRNFSLFLIMTHEYFRQLKMTIAQVFR